ncbi:MAG: sensor domain-containing diguanylate cyclase [Candidatus Dadabacteria bacterium]|nr:MAG: sensor domain-containing diguanylate cyclase [Candidatus Dadabacteria bacterium]
MSTGMDSKNSIFGQQDRAVARWPAWLVLALGLVATLGATVAVWRTEVDRAREAFNREANDGALALQRELQLVLTQVNGLGYYFASDHPDPERFRALVRSLSEQQPAVRGVAWLLPETGECWTATDLRSRDLCGRWQGGQLGLDLDNVIDMVQETGTPELIGYPTSDGHLLLQLAPAGAGAVAGLLDLATIAQTAGDDRLFPDDMMVRVLDKPDEGTAVPVFQHVGTGEPLRRYRYVRALSAGPSRQLTIEAWPKRSYLWSAVPATPWVIAGAGLLISFLGFFYVGSLIRYTANVEAEVQERTRQLDQANRQLAILARLDPLTGLRNRRAFLEDAESVLGRCSSQGEGAMVMMIDIDHFKQYNDHYGHRAGDHCLQRVAAAIASCCRGEDDTVGRYGGEEFAVVIPCNAAIAAQVAERIRDAVAQMEIPHGFGGAGATVSISAGVFVSEHVESANLLSEWLEFADQALYRAKAAGRNRIEYAGFVSPGAETSADVSA